MEKTLLELATSLGGFAGLVCAALIWYLGREVESLKAIMRDELRRFGQALDRHARMELMRLIASPHVSADVKNQVGEQLKEVEAANPETK